MAYSTSQQRMIQHLPAEGCTTEGLVLRNKASGGSAWEESSSVIVSPPTVIQTQIPFSLFHGCRRETLTGSMSGSERW